MKGLLILPMIGALSACGYVSTGINDYRTIYPTTTGCCNSMIVAKPCCNRVVIRPAVPSCGTVVRSCGTKIINRPVTNPCCGSYVQTYDTLSVSEPVDVATIGYDYY